VFIFNVLALKVLEIRHVKKRYTKFFLRIYPGDYIASYQIFIKNEIVKKITRNLSRLTVGLLNNRTR